MVTPKDKAKELVGQFKMYDIQICDLMSSELEGYEEEHYKQCALICVDEIINTYPTPWSSLDIDPKRDYWTEVKQEINKL